MTTLKTLVEEGKFDHVGLSEVSADTIRRANEVSWPCHSIPLCINSQPPLKIHPIAAVEIEVSPWSYEPEAKKGWSLFLRAASKPSDLTQTNQLLPLQKSSVLR